MSIGFVIVQEIRIQDLAKHSFKKDSQETRDFLIVNSIELFLWIKQHNQMKS